MNVSLMECTIGRRHEQLALCTTRNYIAESRHGHQMVRRNSELRLPLNQQRDKTVILLLEFFKFWRLVLSTSEPKV